MAGAPRAIGFSADDYGIAPATSATIRSLIAAGRLTATSAMTTFPEWPEAGRALAPLGDRADLGLHLTLTDHAPLTRLPRLAPEGRLPSFPALLRAAHLGRVDAAEVRAELHAQLDAFEGAVGRPPDHLDGHHHVQQLPVVRDVVVEVARDRLGRRAWVRTCAEPVGRVLGRGVALPRALAFAAAARPLARALDAAGVPRPTGFSGAYGFDADVPFATRLAAFLRDAPHGAVVMLHPGADDDVLRGRDSLVGPRAVEASALAADDLPEALARAGVRLARLSDVLAA